MSKNNVPLHIGKYNEKKIETTYLQHSFQFEQKIVFSGLKPVRINQIFSVIEIVLSYNLWMSL